MWKYLDKTLSKYQIDGMLGYIPDHIVRVDDPRPIKDQVASNYAHGGGYSPWGKGEFKLDLKTKVLKYPGDPPFKPIAELQVRDELFIMYRSAISAIVQKNGSFDIIRMD